MYLIVSGDRRQFYYHSPRQGMLDEGVRAGTLLFNGQVSGNHYHGTAYVFSAHCGARPYQVSGSVEENGGRVTMTGTALVIDSNCRPLRRIRDRLVFEFLYRD